MSSMDKAKLIVRFTEALKDEYSEDRDDPVISRWIIKCQCLYSMLKRDHSFSEANRIALETTIFNILEQP
jgi:hypothetical protein